jgi:hypothetical protein
MMRCRQAPPSFPPVPAAGLGAGCLRWEEGHTSFSPPDPNKAQLDPAGWDGEESLCVICRANALKGQGRGEGREGGTFVSTYRDQSIVAEFGIAIAFNVIDLFTSLALIQLSWT